MPGPKMDPMKSTRWAPRPTVTMGFLKTEEVHPHDGEGVHSAHTLLHRSDAKGGKRAAVARLTQERRGRSNLSIPGAISRRSNQ
jgi:hypothetical protein